MAASPCTGRQGTAPAAWCLLLSTVPSIQMQEDSELPAPLASAACPASTCPASSDLAGVGTCLVLAGATSTPDKRTSRHLCHWQPHMWRLHLAVNSRHWIAQSLYMMRGPCSCLRRLLAGGNMQREECEGGRTVRPSVAYRVHAAYLTPAARASTTRACPCRPAAIAAPALAMPVRHVLVLGAR